MLYSFRSWWCGSPDGEEKKRWKQMPSELFREISYRDSGSFLSNSFCGGGAGDVNQSSQIKIHVFVNNDFYRHLFIIVFPLLLSLSPALSFYVFHCLTSFKYFILNNDQYLHIHLLCGLVFVCSNIYTLWMAMLMGFALILIFISFVYNNLN